jgi:glycosyltransferase involved in cell wall biosynthesis
MKLLIIVPAYNEEESLPHVLKDIREHVLEADVLVVDDGSIDRSAAIARQQQVDVLKLPFNLGIGGAMQAGYLYARKHSYDLAVQFDGDGQHIAREIGKLLVPLQTGQADLVIGSRFIGDDLYKPSVYRKIGMLVFSSILSRIIGTPVTDTTSGFRGANRQVIEFCARNYPDDYPEVEALVLLHKAGFRIVEVPVRMRERFGGRSSITAVRSAYYMVKVLLAVFVDLLKKVR